MRQTDYATDRLYDRLTMRQNDYANPRRKPFPDRILDICYLFACQLLGHQCVYLLTARAPMPVHHQRKHIFLFFTVVRPASNNPNSYTNQKKALDQRLRFLVFALLARLAFWL
jgi:hypothetical protein